jgi:tRNA G18 (ribose-2'-O)-methylase SpoU
VRESCDFLLNIPIEGPITSLNASVSAAVTLAEWKRQTSTPAPEAK